MRERGKNKGFTLIEVIIALAILAVALAPLIANFIVSSKMNLRSRKNLNAMNLAQDMMEGMRAYSTAEIIEKLDAACGPTPVTLESTLLPEGTNYNSCVKNLDDSYTISDVQTAAGKGNDKTNKYYVDVELIPDTAVYDGKDMAAISTVDQYWNPVYTMSQSSQDDEDLAVNEIYKKVKDNVAGTPDPDVLRRAMQREIKLNMKVTTDSLNNKAYSTTVEVVYSIKPGEYTNWGIDAGNPSSLNNAVYTKGPRNISKAAASDCPTAVYLYYTGLKYADPTYAGNDIITITNQTEQDITVYLIRTQAERPEDRPVGADAYNNYYRCRVNLEAKKEGGNYITVATDPGWIHLVTNVRYHLSYGEEDNKRNRTEDSPANILPPGIISYYDINRADIYYNTTANKIVESDYQECISDGYQKNDQGLLYKVRLTIYELKADPVTGLQNKEVMATYDGGTVN